MTAPGAAAPVATMLPSPKAGLGWSANVDLPCRLSHHLDCGVCIGGTEIPTEAEKAEAAAERRKALGLPAKLTPGQAINWIAFREASDANLTKEALTGRYTFTAKWSEPAPDGRYCGLMRALDALAGGDPLWTPRPIPPGAENLPDGVLSYRPPEFARLEAETDALVRRTGRTAADLHAEIKADLETYAAKLDAYAAAKAELDDAEQDGLIAVFKDVSFSYYKTVHVLALWPARDQSQSEPERRRTGTAGRPSSKDLAAGEMRRRADAGEMATKVSQEAKHLCAWLRRVHPYEPQPLPKSLADALRAEHRNLKASASEHSQ